MLRDNPEVTFIGVTNPGDGNQRERDKFINNMTVQIPHVLEDAGEVWAEFDVVSQPSMVFVAADGSWERHVGRQDPLELLDRVTALLASK